MPSPYFSFKFYFPKFAWQKVRVRESGWERKRDNLSCFRGQGRPPEQPEPSLVYSQPSTPASIEGRDSIASSFSHPLYFLFSSQPLVPTDNSRKMKGGEGALCLCSPCLHIWEDLFQSSGLVRPCPTAAARCTEGHAYLVPTCTHTLPACAHAHSHTQMLSDACTLSPHAFSVTFSIWLYFGRTPLE